MHSLEFINSEALNNETNLGAKSDIYRYEASFNLSSNLYIIAYCRLFISLEECILTQTQFVKGNFQMCYNIVLLLMCLRTTTTFLMASLVSPKNQDF